MIINQDDPKVVQLIKDQIMKGASDQELQLFINNCNRTGLDPFQKQCWAIKRWDSSLGREVFAFQTGVDGFRVIANRSDKYAGQLGPFWCGEDGIWKDLWLSTTPPLAAKVAILKSDFKEPLWAVAKFSSYAAKKKDGSLTPFWLKMPEVMIAKVAECLAIRKSFPQDLSGIYSDVEMDEVENGQVPVSKIKDVTPVNKNDSTSNTPQVDENNKSTRHFADNNVPAEPTQKPIVNHAIPSQLDFKTYKTNFTFGAFKSGLSFDELGKNQTQEMRKSISVYLLRCKEDNNPAPQQLSDFMSVSEKYLESLE